MRDLPILEALGKAYRKYVAKIEDAHEWQRLTGAAIWHRQAGDFDAAISAMLKAIDLTKAVPKLSEQTAISLNYLADLYLLEGAISQAEETIREAIAQSRDRYPLLLAANLWILAGIQLQENEFDEALESAEKARNLYQQRAHSYGIGQTEELIAKIAVRRSGSVGI